MSGAEPAAAAGPPPSTAVVAPQPRTQEAVLSSAPAPAPAPAPPPPRPGSPPVDGPPVCGGRPPSPGKAPPEKRQAPAPVPASAGSDGGGGGSPAKATPNPAHGQVVQGQTTTATRPSPDIPRPRADLTTGPTARTSPSNSPSRRPKSVSYGGVIPALAPSGAIAGVAGPGGGALSGVYLGALGYGGWGGGHGGGNGGGGGGGGGGGPQQQNMNPLLPPVSPASATSSGRFVVGVSPTSASSLQQKGMFSVTSSATSGADLVYSPSPKAGSEVQEALRHQRMCVGARELQTSAVGAALGSATNVTLGVCRSTSSGIGARGGTNSACEAASSEKIGLGREQGGDPGGQEMENDRDRAVGRSSLVAGEPRPNLMTMRPPEAIVPVGGGGSGGGGGEDGDGGEGLGDYELGEGEGRLSDDSQHMDSDDGDADGLVGSTFLGNFGDHGAVATAAGVVVGSVGGGAEGWARVRGLKHRSLPYRHHHPRITPTDASPKLMEEMEESQRSTPDDAGLGGVEFLSSPGGTGVLDTFCSPLSEATAAAAGSEMTQAAKLTTSVRFGGVSDIQANLVRAEKSQLIGRDGEGASLLMHAAQRGETEVFRVVLEFLVEKLTQQEVLAEFCAQDEDGQTPLLFAARSGSGAVFRQALEALLARATPEKVLQELTAKEKGDWTPLMAAAESGSVECFHEVLKALRERGSEEKVMSELTTKDNGGWSPLMFASCSGNRGVFIAALEAFLERGDEGFRVVKEQLLMGSGDRQKGSILEAVTLAGWLSRSQLTPAVLDLLDATWDELEYNRMMVSAEQEAFQHAVRQRDLLGLSCLLSHGFGLSPALIEGLVESCGPRCVQDCFLEAVASARNPLVPSLGLLSSLSTAEERASCPLHASWFAFMQRKLERLVLQVLSNLPVSTRAFNKRGIGGWSSSNVTRLNSLGGMSSGASVTPAPAMGGVGAGGGAAGVGFHRRLMGSRCMSGNGFLAAGVAGWSGSGAGASNSGGHAFASGLEGNAGKAADCGGISAEMAYYARSRESLMVARWVFEPESEAVGMRCATFEGPLAVALRLGWDRFVCSPVVLDLLWSKLTAGVELGMFSSAVTPAQWHAEQVGPAAHGASGAAATVTAAATTTTTTTTSTVPAPAHGTTAATDAAAAAAAAAAALAAADAAPVRTDGEVRRASPGWLDKLIAGYWDITIAPSLQAVLVGVVTRPDVFYRVPAARLAFDGVVYMCMTVVYVIVLYRVESGRIDLWEMFMYLWVVGMFVSRVTRVTVDNGASEDFQEEESLAAKKPEEGEQPTTPPPGREDGEGRRRRTCCTPFVEGKLAAVVLVVALLCRIGDSVQRVEEEVTGEWSFFDVSFLLLAAAAPLLLFDLLKAAAAFLPELGPSVMALKVLPSMACLLFGTALALHVLYGEGSALLEGSDYSEVFVEAFRSFGVSCGTVARAGLGDVYVPDNDLPYAEALQALLYLFAAAGMVGLVSILLAVLANSRAARPDEMEKRFHLRRARIIVRAGESSRRNTLPSPFNLAQGGLVLVLSATQSSRGSSERRKVISRACSGLGRFIFWLVMGSFALVSAATLLHLTSLLWFWWISLKRIAEDPREAPKTLLAVARTTAWCCFGAPLRLFVLWIAASRYVVSGDELVRRGRAAVRKSVLRGRQAGDYDLSRMLRRTRWGAGGGGSNSLAQGCSVRDIVAAMKDPLQRGCSFRNVASCFADEEPGTVAQIKALAKRNQEHEARISDRLKGLEVAVLSTLARMDAVSDETARVQQQYLTSQSQHVPA